MHAKYSASTSLVAQTLSDLDGFDAVIDVRTPAEFAIDCVPNAVNFPVLSNEQRIEVGTLYKQVGPFEARRIGAAYVNQNIGQMLQTPFFAQQPKSWSPLVYCWRGGKRSGTLTHMLREVGWSALQLEGGYKNYRTLVLAALEQLPDHQRFIMITGATGTGKTRLLTALKTAGAQTLDLESIASHKGSLLGALPGVEQPSQIHFESQLINHLRQLDCTRPTFVEAESKRIGRIHLSSRMVQHMRAAPCIRLTASTHARVQYLLEDYAYWLQAPDQFNQQLQHLTALHGHAVVNQWMALVNQQDWPQVFEQLLVQHYDPAYKRSNDASFVQFETAPTYEIEPANAQQVAQVAQRLIEQFT